MNQCCSQDRLVRDQDRDRFRLWLRYRDRQSLRPRTRPEKMMSSLLFFDFLRENLGVQIRLEVSFLITLIESDVIWLQSK